MLHRALGALLTVQAAALVALVVAALEAVSSESAPTIFLWASAADLGIGVLAALAWLISRPKETVEAIGHSVAHSEVSGGVVQSGSLMVGRDLNVGTGDDRRAEPAVLVEPSANGSRGFVSVTNPGTLEQFIVKLSNFSAGAPALSLQPDWQTGVAERALKKGESDWVVVMHVEPERLPITNLKYYRISDKPKVDSWMARRRSGKRLVRFLGGGAYQDVEVLVGERYFVRVTVLSDTRDPVSMELSYAVSMGERLVFPFDQAVIDADAQSDRDQVLELSKGRFDNMAEFRQAAADREAAEDGEAAGDGGDVGCDASP